MERMPRTDPLLRATWIVQDYWDKTQTIVGGAIDPINLVFVMDFEQSIDDNNICDIAFFISDDLNLVFTVNIKKRTVIEIESRKGPTSEVVKEEEESSIYSYGD
jgi:hypothetical protein